MEFISIAFLVGIVYHPIITIVVLLVSVAIFKHFIKGAIRFIKEA